MHYIALAIMIIILLLLICIFCYEEPDIDWNYLDEMGKEQMRNAGYSEQEIEDIYPTIPII